MGGTGREVNSIELYSSIEQTMIHIRHLLQIQGKIEFMLPRGEKRLCTLRISLLCKVGMKGIVRNLD